jgi:hypothetical protein
MTTFTTKPILTAKQPDSVDFGSLLGNPMFSNGPSLTDQFGDIYQAIPVDIGYSPPRTVTTTAVNADRIAASEKSSGSWFQSIADWSHKFDQKIIDTIAPNSKFSSANPASVVDIKSPSSRAKDSVTSALWKIGFAVVALFIGFMFIKALAARGAAKALA